MSDSLDLSSADPLNQEVLERLKAELAAAKREQKGPILATYRERYPECADSICAVAALDALRAGGSASFNGDRVEHDSGAAQPEHIGPYRIIQELDQGGMGIIYEAEDGVLPRRVAVKTIKGAYAHRNDLRQRFERERRGARSPPPHPHHAGLLGGRRSRRSLLGDALHRGGDVQGADPHVAPALQAQWGLSSSTLHDLVEESRSRSPVGGATTMPHGDEVVLSPEPPSRTASNGSATLLILLPHLRAVHRQDRLGQT